MPTQPTRPLPSRSGRHRGPLIGVVLAILVVLLLLLQGIPTAGGVSTPAVTPPNSAGALERSTPGPFLSAVERAPIPTSGPGHDSLCTLGVLPNCGAREAPRSPTARAVALAASDPPSSWANITPPAGHANPNARAYASMTYFPSAHDVLLFGGLNATTYEQDTWTYVNHNWTQVLSNANCTTTTCPSIRAGAMIAYYAPSNAILLFGGFIGALGFVAAYNDTWMFSSGAWHNLTSTAGRAPSPRYFGAMSWDPLDNDVMLFGGALATGALEADTWIFNGTWHNITAQIFTASTGHIPSARAGMAIAASPSGYLLMFGGDGTSGSALWDDPSTCFPLPLVGWWFHADVWAPMKYGGSCVQAPLTAAAGAPLATQPPGNPPPCGRVNPGLGWSPKNQHFVLYGGYGPSSTTSSCGGTDVWLNDTYLYQNPPGAGFDWLYAGDAGDPSNRSDMAFASDFTDGYFLIFGGEGSGGATLFSSTYRYFALVHARLTGPSTIDANTSDLSFNVPFVVTGFGGSGNLSYAFTIAKLRSVNSLVDRTGADCSVLANATGGNPVHGPLPYDGVASYSCEPTATSFNQFRITVHVWDIQNTSDSAKASWTCTVQPPQTEKIFSEFKKVFYSGFSLLNTFGVYAKLNNLPANTMTGSLGSLPVSFTHISTFWWNSTPIDMSGVTPGSALRVTGDWSGWDVNATYHPQMVATPSWLASLFAFTGANQEKPSFGSGPWNKTYTIYENYSWSVSSSSSFAIPSPMVSGDYSIIPAISVTFSATSSGTLSLKGSLTSKFPSINLGPAELKFSISVSLSGKFTILNDTQGISDIQWGSAKATLTVTGDVSASVPLYGFNVLGVQVGFTLEVEVKATLALTTLLAPTTDTTKEILHGVQVMVSQLMVALTLALSVGVKFGIAIASIEIGGTMSIALTFGSGSSVYISAGWLNGSIDAEAQFLFWSVSWSILGPAVIYNWTGQPPGPLAPIARSSGCPTCYNSGQNASWTTQPRYYATGSYDNLVWSATVSSGPAVSDVYPFTQVSAAPAPNGAYLFYTDDNVQVPVQQGLRVSGLHLDPSTNQVTALPSPNDPGFVVDQPRATTLPDGSLYVLWAALPLSESNLPSPVTLTTLQLHGARFSPSNQSWGPIRTWSTWGLAEAYGLDGSTAPGRLVELVVPSFLVGDSTLEQMVVYDLTTGRQLSNLTVRGLSTLTSVRAGLGDAVLKDVGGNYSIVNLTTGSALTFAPSVVPGSHLIGASFVTGSNSVVVLLYQNRNATQTLLYDLLSQQVLETLSTDQSATQAAAAFEGGSYFVFDSVRGGIAGWRGSGAFVTNLSLVPETNLQEFGLVRLGSSLLLYAVDSNGNLTQPIVALEFAEVGGSALNATTPTKTPPPSNPSGSSGSNPNYLLYLGIGAGADVLLLAVIALLRRKRGGGKGPDVPSSGSGAPPEDAPPKPGAG